MERDSLIDIYLPFVYNKIMIKSFADKETNKVYHQEFSKKLPQSIQRIALRKLMMIEAANRLEDALNGIFSPKNKGYSKRKMLAVPFVWRIESFSCSLRDPFP